MKVEITSQIVVSDWRSPIVIITQNEYMKSDLTDINDVVSMLCNINCFERELTEMENDEILKIFSNFKKGCKVFFGVKSNLIKTERHLEVCVLTASKKLLPISQYDEKTDSCYVIQRKFNKYKDTCNESTSS